MAENYTHPILVRLNKESDMKNYEKVIEYLLKYQGCHHKGEFYKIKIDELKKIIIGVNSMLKIKETKY
jgi:ribosomal protein L20A (L18A)